MNGFCTYCCQILALFYLDVKIAFLFGDLKETMYITPPDYAIPNIICIFADFLDLYMGSNNSTRMVSKFLEHGFTQSNCDHSFLQKSFNGRTILLVYVDGDDQSGIASLKQILQSSFHMKDLGHCIFSSFGSYSGRYCHLSISI